ncbi:MAG: nucleotide exchange factor GrpE [Muribaculaceae bacterium]|nr:nucleotide exchange factor GrpE [Muribaculaceae bacterium]
MSKDKHDKEKKQEQPEMELNEQPEQAAEINDVADEVNEEQGELETLKNALSESQNQLENQKKEYLFLMAEFDNFRKRNVRERADLLKNAAESVLKGLLPIVDDFERGLDAIKDSSDAKAVKEGMLLIYNKLVKYLEQNGVKEIPTDNVPFDTEYHEAIALVPVDDNDKKGKVIDTVAKGYTLNDKVIRHAKVAVGQ